MRKCKKGKGMGKGMENKRLKNIERIVNRKDKDRKNGRRVVDMVGNKIR